MISWLPVFFNGLWILGLAVLLAGFGAHYWLANQEGRRLAEQLGRRAFRQIFWLGLALVSAVNHYFGSSTRPSRICPRSQKPVFPTAAPTN